MYYNVNWYLIFLFCVFFVFFLCVSHFLYLNIYMYPMFRGWFWLKIALRCGSRARWSIPRYDTWHRLYFHVQFFSVFLFLNFISFALTIGFILNFIHWNTCRHRSIKNTTKLPKCYPMRTEPAIRLQYQRTIWMNEELTEKNIYVCFY